MFLHVYTAKTYFVFRINRHGSHFWVSILYNNILNPVFYVIILLYCPNHAFSSQGLEAQMFYSHLIFPFCNILMITFGSYIDNLPVPPHPPHQLVLGASFSSHRPHEAPEQRIQQHQLPRFAHSARQRQVDVVGGRWQQHGSGQTEPHRGNLPFMWNSAWTRCRSAPGYSARERRNTEIWPGFQNKRSFALSFRTFRSSDDGKQAMTILFWNFPSGSNLCIA